MTAPRTLAIGAARGAGAAGAVTAVAHFRRFQFFFLLGTEGTEVVFFRFFFVRKGGWVGLFFLFSIFISWKGENPACCCCYGEFSLARRR